MADTIYIDKSGINTFPEFKNLIGNTAANTKFQGDVEEETIQQLISDLKKVPVNDENELNKTIENFLIEKTAYPLMKDDGIKGKYKNSLSKWIRDENKKYKGISQDDVSAYNSDQTEEIHNKITNAQQNFAQKVVELVENTEPAASEEDLKNAEKQLEFIEETYKGKREMELSSALYFGMPIAQAGPTLTLISAAAAGSMLFLTPLAVLAYSLTYTINNIKHEGSYTFNSKLLLGLSVLAISTTALAFVSFAGITLPITGPAIVGIASTINFGLFLWSFKLESDRNNAAADLLNTKITRLESSLVEITDADPNAETKRKLVNQSIKVMLYQYTDLVRTIKAPWSKQTHLKNLENFKTSIAHRTINIHMGIIDFSTKRNLTTQKNTYIDNIKEALKEQGINPNLVDEIKNVRIDDDGTTSLRGRSQMNMDDFLKKASIGVDGKVDETKYQELKKIVQSFEIDRNLITLVNSKKQMFVDDTKIDKISIQNNTCIDLLNEARASTQDKAKVKTLTSIISKILEQPEPRNIRTLLESYGEGSDEKNLLNDENLFGNGKSIDSMIKKIDDIVDEMSKNEALKAIKSTESHLHNYGSRDLIYYSINVTLIWAGIIGTAVSIILGGATVMIPPVAIAVTALIGIFVLSSVAIYAKNKIFTQRAEDTLSVKSDITQGKENTNELANKNNLSIINQVSTKKGSTKTTILGKVSSKAYQGLLNPNKITIIKTLMGNTFRGLTNVLGKIFAKDDNTKPQFNADTNQSVSAKDFSGNNNDTWRERPSVTNTKPNSPTVTTEKRFRPTFANEDNGNKVSKKEDGPRNRI